MMKRQNGFRDFRRRRRQGLIDIKGVQAACYTTNDSEKDFLFWMEKHLPGQTAFRTGWPDFFFPIAEGGGLAVEVKSTSAPNLNERQVAMFSALEQMGIVVAIWCPRFPGLIAWRKWHKAFSKSRIGIFNTKTQAEIKKMIQETAAEVDEQFSSSSRAITSSF